MGKDTPADMVAMQDLGESGSISAPPQGLLLHAPTPKRLNAYSYHLHMFLKPGCLKPFLWELALNAVSLIQTCLDF